MELVYRLLGHSVHGRARLGRFDLLWIEVSVFHRAVFFLWKQNNHDKLLKLCSPLGVKMDVLKTSEFRFNFPLTLSSVLIKSNRRRLN